MKQKLFTFLCLCILCIGSVWGENKTAIFSGWTYSSGKITSGSLQNAPTGAKASLSTTYTNANQMTKDKSQTLTLSGFDGCTIKGVTVHVKTNASSGGGTGTLTINGNEKGALAATGTIGGSFTDKTFTVTPTTVNESGTVVIVLKATANSFYCDKYSIIYEENTNPSITASNIDLAADATSGEIAYTISNPIEGKSLTTETSATWISDINVGTEKVTFTTTANTGAQREGTITLKYEGATDKNVTITQAKATTFASIEALVAAGAPASDGKETVTVTLTNEPITKFYTSSTDPTKRNGIYLMAGEKEIEIYCQNVPDSWIAGGTVSGTLENCAWKVYSGTWELCPANWNELTYTAPATYAINIDDAIANGTVEASPTESAPGLEVSLTVTPDEHYQLSTLTVTDASSKPVTVTDNKFTMPASDVTVSATFAELPKYTVTVSDGDESWTEYVDETIELISRTSTNPDYTFVGWSETNVADETTDAPTLVANPYTVSKTVCLYPVYKRSVVGSPENQTVSVSIADYAKDNNWSNGSQYTTIELDDNISVTATDDGNTAKYYTSGENWRMYQTDNSTWNVIATNDAELTSVKFTYTVKNTGILSYNNTTYDSDSEIELSGNASGNFTVVNSGTADNGQVQISAIEVKYTIAATTNYFVSVVPVKVTITKAGWATACIPFASTVEGATAYYVTVDKEKVILNKIEGTIPAETGVVLEGEEGTATFTLSTNTPESVDGNLLVGTTEAGGKTFSAETGTTYYILSNGANGVGFYYDNVTQDNGASAYCNQYKAVLAVPTGSGAPSFFTFDDATAINGISSVKTSGVRYNLNGQAVGEDYKGIVIVNGKKMFNK